MNPEIIIMLTNNDITVTNAEEVFESCKDLPAKKWGFKDIGLPKEEMIQLAKKMKDAGKETYIEVVTIRRKAVWKEQNLLTNVDLII